ncbi:hypothetical protein SLA2020_273250 [Shorea laevis]
MHEYRLTDSTCHTAASSSLKDSYALCRVFKKTIQIMPKTKREEDQEETNIGNVEKDSVWVMDEQFLFEDETNSRGKEADDENFIHEYSNNKFPSDTSSSDLTQGTPADQTGMADDLQAPFASDEANSAAHFSNYLGVDFPSNHLIQDTAQIPNYTSLDYQVCYPPLELEDFPQINLAETSKPLKPEIVDEYMSYDKIRDYMNGTLEEIFSLCDRSSQENSMHDKQN